ncbi:hypothetical protein JGH11_00675 [Dysgonomonas sp. Marseille-P4677]|uniref:DUF6340 family protein n=1 Tax=Dysgonomonas sp. Marseille-P4677 TaxID=2364790 RepID=UPI001913AA83|nr:DUF6340 family protein [Dysgonomonas sp. Marseille-P4677]MBK5719373.1 hypothetical protein [Dysgonomonas sp. Marseille-P4677]
MKYIVSFIIAVFALGSCTSINYITIDTRQPALVSFPPEVTKVLLVDNSFSHNENQEEDYPQHPSIISLDSSRAIFLNSLKQFMNEEKYFINVDLYPKNTYSGTDEDTKPLSVRKVQALCRETDADALISLDLFVVSAQLETENTGYFSTYSILGSKIGAVVKPYASDGSEYLEKPIVYVDSLFRSEATDWSRLKNNMNEINSLVSEIAMIGADKVTSYFIPSWKNAMRWYYSDSSSKMKQAAQFAKQGKWQEAAIIWGNLYDTESKQNKKIRLAFNIALANECLDDIENAKEWINTAFELLSGNPKSELDKQVNLYRTALIMRENNIPKLHKQLGIEDIE